MARTRFEEMLGTKQPADPWVPTLGLEQADRKTVRPQTLQSGSTTFSRPDCQLFAVGFGALDNPASSTRLKDNKFLPRGYEHFPCASEATWNDKGFTCGHRHGMA
jgi:hypothetical protein